MTSKTRTLNVRDLLIGGGAPISVQSMCATHTRDTEATLRQIEMLHASGADLIRVAVDSSSDVESLKAIRSSTRARLVVDLQENFPLAEDLAPYVDKIRYNPGHLRHLQKERPVEDKVAWLVGIAQAHGLAIRVGVNCGSIDPVFKERFPGDHLKAIVESAAWHCDLLDQLKFSNYLVSLKDSDPGIVVACNLEFAKRRPDVPLHLGVTEAGLLPEAALKTQWAFQQLIPRGIGDTIRVSLTVRAEEKDEEAKWGRRILDEIAQGRRIEDPRATQALDVISCPSCSRVENGDFVQLAMQIRDLAKPFSKLPVKIAVMGCRVNGPGETDDADLGVWCGPTRVTLKRKSETLGVFFYSEILPKVEAELKRLSS